MSHGGPPVIDVHLHAVPPALVAAVEAGAFPAVSVARHERGLVFSFPGMAPSPPGPAGLGDFPRLAGFAAAEGIDCQVVGPWTDLLGYTLPGAAAAAWARAYNEALAEACAAHPGMIPMAAIPLPYPGAAVREMEAAHALGCRGIMIGTDVPGLDLDAPGLEPVWEAAAGLGMPILAHPTFLCVPARLQSRGLKNAVGRAGEGAVALTRLVYSGALLRHPGLAVVAALGGGGLVPLWRRIVRNQEVGWAEASGDVEASLRRLHFDSIVLDPAYLRYLVERVGADRVVLGSDYPFPWEPHPRRFVEEAGLGPEQTTAVLGGTAAALYGLRPPSAETR
jgi:aminocarboxymuconate-semialdehyde decarboxylase